MELTWEPDSCTESRGYSFKVCDPNKLGIGLRQTDWDERIVADLNERRHTPNQPDVARIWSCYFRPPAPLSGRAHYEWKTSKPQSNRK